MASPRSWPFDDDEDRPSGSVRPLSQADLQAILAHLDDDPDGLLAGTGADRPVAAVRVRASVGRPGASPRQVARDAGGRMGRLDSDPALAVAAILGIGAGGGLLGSLLAPRLGWWSADSRPWRPAGGCGPAQPGRCGLAAWGGRGATHRPAARPAGAARAGWSCTTCCPRQPGQPRSPGDRPRWGVRDRLQAVSRPPSARPIGRLWHGRYPLAPILRAVAFEPTGPPRS